MYVTVRCVIHVLIRFTQSGFAFPEALTEAARERTARLDMSDALELSERTVSAVRFQTKLCETCICGPEIVLYLEFVLVNHYFWSLV